MKLSGGEKQRLSIARAMIKKSLSAHWDGSSETENKIKKGLSFLSIISGVSCTQTLNNFKF